MKVISCYLREEQKYTQEELKRLLYLDDNEFKRLTNSLKDYGIIKFRGGEKNLNDLADEGMESSTSRFTAGKYYYIFRYVGIIVIACRVLKIYPKYIQKNPVPDREFKQVINVLAKYTLKTEQSMTAYVGEVSATSSNALRVILQLMCDYYEYGLYDSRREVRESNSDGVIDWERTISNSLVLFKHGKPYYTELATKRNIDDLLDYIRLLHEWVLTDCSRQLAEAGLDIIFGFEELNLSEAELEDFGDKEYIFHELECELGVQFNTRKQMLLKTIYAYIAEAKAVVNDTYEVSFFGTTAYAMVWQDVCAEVFNSKLDVRLDRLGLNTPIAKDYNSTNKLVEIIEHPLWQGKDFCYMASKTLIPDIVTMAKSNGEDLLAILDAKYYSLQMEKGRKSGCR